MEMLSLLGFFAKGTLNVKASMYLICLNFKTQTKLFLTFRFIDISACLRIPMHLNGEIIERNGEQYLQINCINVSFQILCDFKMDMKFDTPIPELVRGVVNEQANSNWRKLKPHIESEIKEYIAKIAHKAIAPIYAKVPIRDFFL